MPRALLFITVTVLLGLGTSCEQSAPKQPAPTVPVLVQVFRDRYFAADLAQANAQFARSSPSVRTGRSVVLEVKDDVPYWDIPTRLRTFAPDVLILYSQGFAPDDPAIRNQLGAAQLVCGTHPAFISTSVSGEEREGAQAYLSFLTSHCIGTPPAQPTSPQQAQQTDEDEHRPSCSSRECKQIKAF